MTDCEGQPDRPPNHILNGIGTVFGLHSRDMIALLFEPRPTVGEDGKCPCDHHDRIENGEGESNKDPPGQHEYQACMSTKHAWGTSDPATKMNGVTPTAIKNLRL